MLVQLSLPMVNFAYVTSKFCTVSFFVIVQIKELSHTEFIDTF